MSEEGSLLYQWTLLGTYFAATLLPFYRARTMDRRLDNVSHANVRLIKEGLATLQVAFAVFQLRLILTGDYTNLWNNLFFIGACFAFGAFDMGHRAVARQEKALRAIHGCPPDGQCDGKMTTWQAMRMNKFELVFVAASIVWMAILLNYAR